jgi:MFS family permease
MAPVFTAAISDDLSLAAYFMTSTVIGGAVFQWPLGFLSDRIGRRQVLIGTTAIGAAVSTIIVVTVDGLSFLGINLLGAAWGAVAFPLYALSVAHTNDYADPSEYVTVSSGLLLMFGIGAVLGPFAASAMMTLTSFTSLYVFTGAVDLLLVVYMTHRIFRRKSAPTEQHIAFSDALATAQTASQVYEEEIQHLAEDDDIRRIMPASD